MNQQTFNDIVTMFKAQTDRQQNNLQMNHLLIKHKDQIFHHDFTHIETKSDIRSISKTVMTIVLGIIIKQSQAGKLPKIDEHTFIYPLIKDTIQLTNKKIKINLKRYK